MLYRAVTIALFTAIAACGRIGYDAMNRVDDSAASDGPGGMSGTGGMSSEAGAGLDGQGESGGTGGQAGIDGIPGGALGSGGGDASAGAGGTADAAGGAAGSAGGGGGTADAAGGAAGSADGGPGPADADAGGAPDGGACVSATYGGHTYALCDGLLSWADAQNDCLARGMRLVRIDDAQENLWVLANAYANVDPSENHSLVWRWLGGNDLAVHDEWRWSDGALFWLGGSNGSAQNGLYANWAAGHPGAGGGASDCAVMQHNTKGFWSGWDCAQLQPYVCEGY
jgi:hypothetical protein